MHDIYQISVIIPTQDRAQTVLRALNSVLVQEFTDLEVLIVDDGSTDGTLERLRAVGDRRVRILQTPRLGVSAARNHAIRQARAPLIAFLDSDDEWLPGKLAAQVQALAENSQAALCHTEEVWIRRGERVNACKHHEKKGGEIFAHCLRRCVVSPSSAVVRRAVLDQVGLFDETLPVCEDYDLWLRITALHPVIFLDTPFLVKYGGHDDQLSRRYPVMDSYRITALEKLLGETSLSDAQRRAVEEMIVEKSRIIENGARKRGNLAMAQEYAAKIQQQRD